MRKVWRAICESFRRRDIWNWKKNQEISESSRQVQVLIHREHFANILPDLHSQTHRGHKVARKGQEWFYEDTGENIHTTSRPCSLCNKTPGEEGHDPCIENLPGVKFACCGHGVREGYIMFNDGRIIRFVPTTIEG